MLDDRVITDNDHKQFDIAVLKLFKQLKNPDAVLKALKDAEWSVELYVGPVIAGDTDGMLIERLKGHHRKVVLQLQRALDVASAVWPGQIQFRASSA